MQKLNDDGSTQEVDLGFVGEIDSVNEEVVDILILIASNFIPVIASLGLGVDVNSDTYNINADLVASRVAKFLGAERLLLLTNIKGVLDKQGRVLTHLLAKEIDHLIADRTILGGMIPKIKGTT
ncbi:Acetylglutamate kinase [Moraxella catarrhalis]|nr:Acetylglutamate kinase [Moraxella catarrhalis]OAV36690.1 Acetylglutamate kinase [Moraxella catarrhalis]